MITWRVLLVSWVPYSRPMIPSRTTPDDPVFVNCVSDQLPDPSIREMSMFTVGHIQKVDSTRILLKKATSSGNGWNKKKLILKNFGFGMDMLQIYSPCMVSIDPRRLSPMVREIIWAPGATPLRSEFEGKHPAAIAATWVPGRNPWI